jgi:pimeloyl-ACP methyl ester carboxylesterase
MSTKRARRIAPENDPPLSDLVEEVHRVRAVDGQVLALTEVRPAAQSAASTDLAFLLLHGFAQNRLGYTLGPMPRVLLDRGARVFLGELRGHGESRVEHGQSWTMACHLELDCPALLEGVLERAGVERVHLVGHSMGGLLGCALLAGDAPLASLTAMATPLLLGAGRPLVRIASFVVGPLATIAPKPRRVPMQHFLGALSKPLSVPDAGGSLRLLQRLTRLANPAAASPESLRAILASADAESPAVMEELARNAVLMRPMLAGVDLVAAIKQASIPLAAVVGTRDIFAPRAAVAPLEGDDHAGPRRIVEVEGGTHVDAIMGHHVPDTIDQLWDFLMQSARSEPPRREAAGGA